MGKLFLVDIHVVCFDIVKLWNHIIRSWAVVIIGVNMIVGSITILLYTVYNNIIIIILYTLLENLTDDAIA